MPDVSWSVRMQDFLTEKLKNAEAAAGHLEHKMDTLKEKTAGFGEGLMMSLETLGIGFALFEFGEFVHKGVESFHAIEQANAQLEAGLESTEGVAGMTMKSLQAGADQLNAHTKYGMEAIKDMQSQLLTFPAITKETFNSASEAILNMATRTHHGVDQMSIALGKALQDPVKGIMALHRVGVNFTEGQKEMVKSMVAAGHVAQAQKFILAELSTEYAGSARAAFNADPLAQFEKTMNKVRVLIGEVGEKIVTYLAPAMEAFATFVKDAVVGMIDMAKWMKKNSEYITATAIIVAGLATGFLVLNANIILTTLYLKGLTAVTWLLDIAMSANPLGIMITALAALSAGLYLAYQHSEELRGGLAGIGAVAMAIIPVFKGLGEAILGAFLLDPGLVKAGMADMQSALQNISSGGGIGKIFDAAYFKETHPESTMAYMLHDPDSKIPVKKGAKGTDGTDGKTKKESVSGPKSYIINIKIDNLVREFSIHTTNIKEGTARAKEMVAQALLSAVNDSQLVAGN